MQTGKLTLEKSSGSWAAWKPDGSSLSLTGTTTDGLQECLTAAAANNWQFEALGAGSTVLNCTSPVILPADVERMNVHIGCGITFGPGVQYGLVFDSWLHSTFRLDGEIKYTYDGRNGASGAAVILTPQASSNFKLVVDNDIYIRRIFGDGCSGGTIGLFCSTDGGSITRNRIYVHEIEGGNPTNPTFANGILVNNTEGKYFQGNQVEVRALLIWTDMGIRVGSSNNGLINKNVWTVNVENSTTTARQGIITYATKDYYVAAVSGNITTAFNDQGTSNQGVLLN